VSPATEKKGPSGQYFGREEKKKGTGEKAARGSSGLIQGGKATGPQMAVEKPSLIFITIGRRFRGEKKENEIARPNRVPLGSKFS